MGLSQAERKADVIKKTGTACVMRDGCRLATDVYLPSEEGKWPAVLYRTPYGRNSLETDPLYSRFPELVADGYAVVTQDLRGTGESEGTLGLNGQNEFDDGYDAVEWLAQQPFCDGSVGMFGLSYPGFVQNAAASRRPPHLKAVCPFMCPSQQPFGIRKGHVRHMQHLFWAYAQTLAHPDNYIPDASRREDVLLQMRENFSRLERKTRNTGKRCICPLTLIRSGCLRCSVQAGWMEPENGQSTAILLRAGAGILLQESMPG